MLANVAAVPAIKPAVLADVSALSAVLADESNLLANFAGAHGLASASRARVQPLAGQLQCAAPRVDPQSLCRALWPQLFASRQTLQPGVPQVIFRLTFP